MGSEKVYTKADGVELKEYLEKQCAAFRGVSATELAALRREIFQAFKERDKMLALERGLIKEKMLTENHIRDELRKQTNTLVTQVQHDADVKSLVGSVSDLEIWRATQEGKASQQSVLIALLFSIIGTIMGLAGLAIAIARFATGG